MGRAGRRDGNALLVTLANARAHDLYFFEEPLDMIDGEVRPPGIYLNASAVLERQLTAFCIDRWIHEVGSAAVIPRDVGKIFSQIGASQATGFPHDFIAHVTANKSVLIAEFLALFSDEEVHNETRQALSDFMFGRGVHAQSGGLTFKVLESFTQLKRDYDDLRRRANQLTQPIKRLEQIDEQIRQPTQQEELEQMQHEQASLRAMAEGIRQTRTLEHLTNDGPDPELRLP